MKTKILDHVAAIFLLVLQLSCITMLDSGFVLQVPGIGTILASTTSRFFLRADPLAHPVGQRHLVGLGSRPEFSVGLIDVHDVLKSCVGEENIMVAQGQGTAACPIVVVVEQKVCRLCPVFDFLAAAFRDGLGFLHRPPRKAELPQVCMANARGLWEMSIVWDPLSPQKSRMMCMGPSLTPAFVYPSYDLAENRRGVGIHHLWRVIRISGDDGHLGRRPAGRKTFDQHVTPSPRYNRQKDIPAQDQQKATEIRMYRLPYLHLTMDFRTSPQIYLKESEIILDVNCETHRTLF